MRKFNARVRASFCIINALALLSCALFLPPGSPGQATPRTGGSRPAATPTPTPDHKGKPVVITFGQPNIWSLDQAHYLLSQLRERSLSLTARELADLDPNETHGTRINFMRQLFELVSEFRQPAPVPSPAASPAPTPVPFPSGTPERVASTDVLDGSLLSTLLADSDLRKRLFSDPKLNAVTRLDNHIQLQYEIIARQLTLLRDEVRPGERLVFLELPQSIYTSDDKADDKLAQVWWQVDGYSKFCALDELRKGIELADQRIERLKGDKEVMKLLDEEKVIEQQMKDQKKLFSLYSDNPKNEEIRLKVMHTPVVDRSNHSCSAESVDKYCRERGGLECKRQQDVCSKYRQVDYWERSRRQLRGRLEEAEDEQYRRRVENLLQGGPADVAEVRKRAKDRFRPVRAENAADASTPSPAAGNNDNAINTADRTCEQVAGTEGPTGNVYDQTAVRTIDIIPHQSSLNVNDVQETIKSSFIAASFSFLFGLGARTSFQRQRDQFEQFLHQELYASGFGKGDSLFGWTFGPIPGTKRVAPGLRTTFVALVVPAEAESVTLSARGCFFHREDYEPPNAMGQNENSKWWDNNDRECSVPKTYLLPIPSGGGTRNFWVTGVEYLPNRPPGQRMVALVKGENFSTQVGVLVNGVPLKQVVEVTRKLPASVRNDSNANCDAVCGEYEVVGPNDISIAFEMPNTFVGTPEITVVGPGRSVSLNHLPLAVRPYGKGVFFELDGDDTPHMFGDGPQVRVGELRLFRDKDNFILGFLRGVRNLNGREEILVNGKILGKAPTQSALVSGSDVAYFHPAKKLYQLRLVNPGVENLDVTIVDEDRVDTRTVANPFGGPPKPAPLAVIDEDVLALDATQGEMAVRLTGTGLANVRLQVLSGASPQSEITSQSATELILRLVQPRVAVKIKLSVPGTDNALTRTIIRRSPARSTTERRDRTDDVNN